MFKKKYIVIAVGIICILLGSFFVNNVLLAQSSGEYDPWLDYNEDGIIDVNDLAPLGQSYGSLGDPTKNVNVTNWPSSLLAEPTVRRIGVYVIGPLNTSSEDYVQVGELVVPKGEKWYLCRMDFAYIFPEPKDSRSLIIRLIMRGIIVMDEVRAWQFGGLELRRPVELFEAENIELWIRMDPSAWVLECSLIIQAWVEGM